VDPTKNPQVVIADGAQGGADSTSWTNVNAQTWTNVLNRLSALGVSSNQVQVAWVKLARANPAAVGDFPIHARSLQADIEQVLRNLKARFPNIQLAFLSNRTRSYETNRNSLNPEPFAYESSFTVKWIVEKQISGDASLNYDTNRGPAVAPFVTWGPYLWSDGLRPRSDGFVWLCNDLTNDFTHPSENGVTKVADQLLAFFRTDPITAPWFLRKPTNAVITTDAAVFTDTNIVPISATFSNSIMNARHWWTFGDGTFSTNERPAKLFTAPGKYTARLLVDGSSGNWRTGSVETRALITYGTWVEKKFTAAELANSAISGDEADPDGDHIANYMEFRMGLEPKSANGLGRGFTASAVGGVRQFSFSRFDFFWPPDVWWVFAEATDELTQWPDSRSGPSVDYVGETDQGLTTRLTVSPALPAASTHQFIRPSLQLAP
jgi:hypothetical protein